MLLMIGALQGRAYETYSVNDDATNCRACHGDYRSDSYISLSDGMNWGNLHNMHRFDILNADCYTCHTTGTDFPVYLAESAGGSGMEPLSCMGCHGRAEDDVPDNPEFGNGYGAGLRQHHYVAGVTLCLDCHLDSDPANYAAVGENVLPPYFANPGNNHPDIPDDPCNLDGSENFRGLAEGLDNDGDGIYDGDDPDCAQQEGCFLNCPGADGGMVNAMGSSNKSPDIDGDGLVSLSDFAQFGAVYGTGDYCADFDCSGNVGLPDFALFASHYGHGPGTIGVCE
jgi:hypothetical protein